MLGRGKNVCEGVNRQPPVPPHPTKRIKKERPSDKLVIWIRRL